MRKQEGSCGTPVREAVARGVQEWGCRQVRIWRHGDQSRRWAGGAKEQGGGGVGRRVLMATFSSL